jgi:hypothetical protein
MMVTDGAVPAHIYKRGGVFFLPQRLLEEAAEQCGGSFVLKDDWSQVLFLCSDAVALSFWMKRPGEATMHTIVSIEIEALVVSSPELVNLWSWKRVDDTWDEVRAKFVGTANVSSYARGIASTYPQCFVARDHGVN